MALNIRTVMTYPLTGAVDFPITFEYLARKFVTVTLIGKDRKELVLNQDFRFTTKTQISTTRAWTAADGYQLIEIRRFTSATERLVDFADGSILRAFDLNISQIQTLHVAEEARDLTADTIGVNNDGNLDARGRRIVNLANAVDDGDAVSFGQLKTMNQNSWQARNESLQFRNEAETFRNQAEVFKNESGTNATKTNQWRNEAEGFRDEAEQFKNTATQQATAAGNSAAAAHQSEVNSENSATASANSAHLAEQQADRAEREADKLGNWNALAGAVESVSGTTVTWAGPARFTNTLTVGSTSDMNGRVTINAPDRALRLNGVAGAPNYIQGLRDGKAEWVVGTDQSNSLSFYSLQFDHGLYIQDGKVAIGRPLHVANAIFATNGDSFGTVWDNGWLSSYLDRFIVDVYLGPHTWQRQTGGYHDNTAPIGHVQTGTTSDNGLVAGISVRPVWLGYHNGTRRIIA